MVVANQALTACASEFAHEPLFLSQRTVPASETIGAVARNLTLSWDGGLLAFDGKIVNGESPQELFVYDRRSGVCTRYRMPVQGASSNTLNIMIAPAFSPDGRRLAVSARRASSNPGMARETRPSLFQYGDIAVFELTGGAARRFGDRRLLYSYPTFSPRGDAVGAMRSRNPVQGGHVETARGVSNHFVEFHLQDGAEDVFAPIEFGSAARFWYAPDGQSVLLNASPPVGNAEQRRATGPGRRAIPPSVWRVPRGAGDLTEAAVPTEFAGRYLDILSGVDRDGRVYVQTVPQSRSSTPIALDFYRFAEGRSELVRSFAGETCTYPCVSADGGVFAWRTVVRTAPGVLKTAFRIVTGDSNELLLADDIISRLQDRIISE